MAATELQVGVARIFGITGSFTVAVASGWPTQSGVSLSGGDISPNTLSFSNSFKVDELVSANGAVIETLIASQNRRELSIEIIPSSTSTTPTRAEAIAVANALGVLSPFAIFTLASFDLTFLNGTWNYMGGGDIVAKRDTYVISNIKIAQFETAGTAGSFAALTIAG